MRRRDREITDYEELRAVVTRSKVCRVAFFDEEYPYIIPLNFGFSEDAGTFILYFHCAGAGKKLELMRRCNKVAFEMDCPGKLIEGDTACDSTMPYESVCGTGVLEPVGDTEKLPALKLLMRQYSDRDDFDFDASEVEAVTVLKLTVREITGKRLKK